MHEIDGYTYLYDIHTYEMQSRLSATKGASLCAVDVAPVLINNEPAQITKVAVTVKKKVIVYRWVDDELKDITVNMDGTHEMNTELTEIIGTLNTGESQINFLDELRHLMSGTRKSILLSRYITKENNPCH
jgi:hypothetical protein